ncbi:membrane protein [Patiriisocius marinistellae]|uniref:Membrane protein n=1 Tax=Patiriisocius marinistellae TaxID=2494560 RepID=A0A5J4FSV8_9FLAO|nr:metal-dependent hydrolase [Patiriisocius marinistellae]GEQ84510.1 membrane protein [Patiriisocius marinistellae]
MDSLTQIVLGAAVGEAVLGKKVGNKAMLYGAIAGTIPDLDVIARFFVDTVTALEIHRGFSHSILFSILFAPVFGWLVSRWEHTASWRQWSWLFFFGFITHPLLDAHTTWGTQLFWPFDLRLAYKNIFVIDPLYTLPFLVFLILAMLRKRNDPKRRYFNSLGLWVSSIYLCITLLLKGITYFKFQQALKDQGIQYIELETKPAPLNTIIWTANVETKDAYLIANYSLFDTKPITFSKHHKNHHLLGDLANNNKIKRLVNLTNGWYIIQEKEGKLFFNDLRFGQLSVDTAAKDYVFSYKLKQTGDGLYISENKKRPEDGKKLLVDLWQRLKGN